MFLGMQVLPHEKFRFNRHTIGDLDTLAEVVMKEGTK